VCVPPLRERPEDIPLLAVHFLKTHAFNRDSSNNLKVQGISQEALDLMSSYLWPGNVRELLNVIERAVSFCDGPQVEAVDLPEQLQHNVQEVADGSQNAEATFKEAKERWVSSFERDYILKLLSKNGGNISHAARESSIDRKYFRKLMRKHGITADQVTEE